MRILQTSCFFCGAYYFSESSVSNAILCCLLYLLTFLVGVCSHFIVLTLILGRYEVNKLISVANACKFSHDLVSFVLQYMYMHRGISTFGALIVQANCDLTVTQCGKSLRKRFSADTSQIRETRSLCLNIVTLFFIHSLTKVRAELNHACRGRFII